MLILFCVVVGRRGNPFSVEIATGASVDDLKTMIKMKKESIPCEADELDLYLALKNGAWLLEEDADSKGLSQGNAVMASYIIEERKMKTTKKLFKLFPKEAMSGIPAYCNDENIHVLVVVPEGARSANESAMELSPVDLRLKQDTAELTEWSAGKLQELPSIHEFMKGLGGCTQGGKLYWRLEEKQIVSIILTGWSGADLPRYTIQHKKCILMGSPGVGKSTLLCLLVFYAVFELKKNVILYRKLRKADQSNCLVYLGYENDQVKYFTLPECDGEKAIEFYKALQLKQEVWLMLDGFIYKDIPEGLLKFKLLATSQQVDLKSQELDDAYCLLHPCWTLKDLTCLGLHIKGWNADHVSERYYYSGGSVREFLRATVDELILAVLNAISVTEDPLALMSSSANIRSGSTQVDRLRRTFITDPNTQLNFFARNTWEQLIDSEFAILTLSGKLKPDYLYRVFNWARAAGHASLAGSVFELFIHLLAADNRLKLYVSQYALPEANKPDCPRHLDVKQLPLQRGRAKCTGTATNYETDLIEWRDDDNFAYWFPACHDFPNIDSIVKLKLESGKKQVAYLQITTAQRHTFDEKQLKTMNKIFKQEQDEPPIYIVVCPDLKACEKIVLSPANAVLEAMTEEIQLFACYYKMDSDISADGPKNQIPLKQVPGPRHNMKKRPRGINN